VTDTARLAQESIGPDEADVAKRFVAFLTEASARRHPTGVMPRFNQGRAAGCVDAEFTVPDQLAAELQVGLFARPGTYRARIRFANAASATDRDKDVRGMSIKVMDVAGENLTQGETSQDFILNSHPVMMVGGSRAFLDLLQANEAGGVRRVFFFLLHPRAASIALASRQNPTSHLEIPYWSTTPYLFGPGRAVKYHLRPSSGAVTPLPNPLTDNYLRERLAERVAREEVRFDFNVQFQIDPQRTPIEDASVEWREQLTPYRTVAHVRIPPQQIGTAENDALCERMSFNPWHALAAHRPLGDYNRARRNIYQAMAAFRQART
jgi:hypothetical protein